MIYTLQTFIYSFHFVAFHKALFFFKSQLQYYTQEIGIIILVKHFLMHSKNGKIFSLKYIITLARATELPISNAWHYFSSAYPD